MSENENIYDNIFDLSSAGTLQFGVPAGGRGFIFIFEPNLAGTNTGTVDVYFGQGTGSMQSRLAHVKAGTIRTGSLSNPTGEIGFTIVPASGAAGILRVKFTRDLQPEASYTL